MKPPIPIAVAASLALACVSLNASTPTHPLTANPPRSVTVSESEAPPVVRAGLLQSTLIVLPAEEKVASVFAGDTVDWAFDGGRVASRFISVKPKLASATTDIHIVSDHGNEYTLELREISSEDDAHFDSKIFINAGDKAAKERLTDLPVFVPAADLDKAKQDAADRESCARSRTQGRSRRKQSSIAANIQPAFTLITPGTDRRRRRLDLKRSGATTSSPTFVGISRRRPRFTNSRTRRGRLSTSTSMPASTPSRSKWTTAIW